jgi:hypothetical protein
VNLCCDKNKDNIGTKTGLISRIGPRFLSQHRFTSSLDLSRFSIYLGNDVVEGECFRSYIEDQTSFGVNVILCSCLWTRKIKPVLVSMLSFVACGHGRSNRFWCQCYPLLLFVDTGDQTSFGVNVA